MNITNILLLLIAAETTYLAARQLRSSVSKIESQSILLDTSVLIDGRIESIARSGLVTAPLVIPRSVVRELQYMADKADHDKRERARYGLDMIEKLQSIDNLTVRIIDDAPLSDGGVDERLVTLAKTSDARLCTTDYNLNKSATVQGVIVLNINEIAHALRIVRLPGESVSILLQQPGQERDQAVGYLDDGTMVVVDNGKSHIGDEVEVEITRALQTVAGKMMFARLVSAASKHVQKKSLSSQPSKKSNTQEKNNIAQDSRQTGSRVTGEGGTALADSKTRGTRTAKTDAPSRSASKSNLSQRHTPTAASSAGPQNKRRRKSMTDRAEDSLVDLLSKQ